MVRIPRAEPTVQTQIAPMPQLAGDGWGAPGRATQQLGQSIASLGDALGSISAEANAEQDKLEQHSAKLTMLEADNEIGRRNAEARATYTGDGKDFYGNQDTVYNSVWDNAMEKIPEKYRSQAEIFRAQRYGPYTEGNIGFGGQKYREFEFGRTEEAIGNEFGALANVPPEQFEESFELTLRKADAIVNSPALTPSEKSRLAEHAAELAKATLEGSAKGGDADALRLLPRVQQFIEATGGKPEAGTEGSSKTLGGELPSVDGIVVDPASAPPQQSQAGLGQQSSLTDGKPVPQEGSAFDIAKSFVGANERADASTLSKFFEKTSGQKLNPRDTAWCAAFVNATLAANGQDGTGTLLARDFLKFGEATKSPSKGDIVVLTRGNSSWQGHVGFYAGKDSKGNVLVLGGNQGNAVSVKPFAASSVLGYRVPPKSGGEIPGASVASAPAATDSAPQALADFRGKSGPASLRYNNPGAMYPGPSSQKFGAVETKIIGGGHKIAVFPDAVSGAAAQFDLLASDKYTGRPVSEAIAKWSGGNSVKTYLAVIQKEAGIGPSETLTREMVADPKFAIPLAKAMATQEAGKPYPLSDEQWSQAHRMALGGPVEPPVASRGLTQYAGLSKVGAGDVEPPDGARASNTIPGPSNDNAQPEKLVQVADASGRTVPQVAGSQQRLPAQNRTSVGSHLRDKLIKALPEITQRHNVLVEKLEKKAATQAYVTGVVSGQIPFNPYDDAGRKIIDEAFAVTDFSQRVFSGDIGALAEAVKLTGVIGYAPKGVVEGIQGLASSKAPEKLAVAYTAVNNIIGAHPQAFAQYAGAKDLLDRAELFRSYTETGLTADQALAKINQFDTPEYKKLVESRKKEADTFVAKITSDKLRAQFDPSFLPFDTPGLDINTNAGRLALLRYQDLARDAFNTYGNEDIAHKVAGATFKRMHGVSQINGQKEVVMYPPESLFNPVGGSHDYIREQAEAEFAKAGIPDVDPKSIRLVADSNTQKNINSQRGASYQIQYVNKYGLPEVLLNARGEPRQWTPDTVAAKTAYIERLNKERIEKAPKPAAPVEVAPVAPEQPTDGKPAPEAKPDAKPEEAPSYAPHEMIKRGLNRMGVTPPDLGKNVPEEIKKPSDKKPWQLRDLEY